MDLNGVGWLTAIVVGGLAGWIAEKVMRSDMGLIRNVLLGIVGAAVLNFLLDVADLELGYGWVRYLVAGVLGGCLLIWLARLVRGRRA
ncbi:GlsB/YeaQ/YmgE family stress response membrane protein [Acuticoccus sp.]|uniref:GlsB/YeaQ/YmgE family stress response membrane protein n=1 Tax=Acuticoccus sp. TaxID=1904378 RepID=UPI003B529FB4